MSNSEKKDRSISNWWFVLLIVVCILLWIVGLWGTHEYVNSRYVIKEPQDILTNPGVFGDSSGAINALFSALAFAWVIFAIILQKKELQLQREELEQTREELEGQKHEFEQQNETLIRQRFENTFFQMLGLQQQFIAGISYRGLMHRDGESKVMDIQGRDVFYYLYRYTNLEDRGWGVAVGIKSILEHEGIKAYTEISDTGTFDHYFGHLYHIVKFVDNSPLLFDSFEDRYQYLTLVRSQLSRYELIWLFYNCLSTNGQSQFKPLIEKYALLKNIHFDLLAKPEHKDLYAESAYKKIPPKAPSYFY